MLAPFFVLWRYKAISANTNKDLPINEEIRDPEVRLIDENGVQLGIMDVRAAQRLADLIAGM